MKEENKQIRREIYVLQEEMKDLEDKVSNHFVTYTSID